MLPKSFSLLMLIVTIQFSQSFAAPRDGILQDGDISQASVNSEFSSEPAKEDIPSDQQVTNPTLSPPESPVPNSTGLNLDNLVPSVIAPTVEDGLPAQPMENLTGAVDSVQSVGEQVGESAMQSANQLEGVANSMPSLNDAPSEKPKKHYSHMLTREQELSILHEMPEFKEIIQAMEKLPDCIYKKLKEFLTHTVPRMPRDNLFTKHFENAALLVQVFERLIVAARTGAIHEPGSQDLFDRIHQAAPEMKAEMNEFNGLMETAQSRLANLGTATNPMQSMTDTSGVNVTAGSVSLPMQENTERFADEFAPSSA